jgi:hypothetical protein
MSAKTPDMLRYFSYAMVLVYAGLGGYVIFSRGDFDYLETWQRVGLGSVIFAYGTYRLWRVVKQQNDE